MSLFTKDKTGKIVLDQNVDLETVLSLFKEYLNTDNENSILSQLPESYIKAYNDYKKKKEEEKKRQQEKQSKKAISSTTEGTMPNIEHM